jgi:hypothetical protein
VVRGRIAAAARGDDKVVSSASTKTLHPLSVVEEAVREELRVVAEEVFTVKLRAISRR